MEEVINKILANDLKELRGLRINGVVPVHPDLINEVIAQVLQPAAAAGRQAGPAGESAAASKSASSGASLPKGTDPVALLRRHLKHLEVGVEAGRIIVNFDFRVE